MSMTEQYVPHGIQPSTRAECRLAIEGSFLYLLLLILAWNLQVFPFLLATSIVV